MYKLLQKSKNILAMLLLVQLIFMELVPLKVYANTKLSSNVTEIIFENPNSGNSVQGEVTFSGYILGSFNKVSDMFETKVYIDNNEIPGAWFGMKEIMREDIKKKYPEQSNNGNCGFSYSIDTSKYDNGNHKIKFIFGNCSKEISFNLQNKKSDIILETPDIDNSLKGKVSFTGYVLSSFDPFAFWHTDIYIDDIKQDTWANFTSGINRPDIESKYPDYPFISTCGFKFDLDTSTISDGEHKIKFKFNKVEKEISFVVKNDNNVIKNGCNNEIIFESPNLSKSVEGDVTFEGYVLSFNNEFSNPLETKVYIDNKEMPGAFVSVKKVMREDIKNKYPEQSNNGNCGFSYSIDTSEYDNGNHKIKFIFGNCSKEISFNLQNKKSDIIIETPDINNSLKGKVSFTGYVLSSFDPFAFWHTDIYIDDIKQDTWGNFTSGINRPDIGSKYPDYPFISTCGFKFDLDTDTILDGEHKIKFEFNKVEKEYLFTVKSDSKHVDTKIVVETPNLDEELSTNEINFSGYIVGNHKMYDINQCKYNVDGLENKNCTTSVLTLNKERQDVKSLYPCCASALHSGFDFKLDTSNLNDGIHNLNLYINDEVYNIEFVYSREHSKIIVENPNLNETATGVINMSGYVLSRYDNKSEYIQKAYIDNKSIDNYIKNFKTKIERRDIGEKFSNYYDAGNSGFSLDIDTHKLSNGPHKLKLIIGKTVSEYNINVKNNEPILNVDWNENIKDGIIKLTGYKLGYDDNLNLLDFNIYIDNIEQQSSIFAQKFGISREDIINNYPQYAGQLNCGFEYLINSTVLSNGKHTVKISLSDIEKEFEIIVNNPAGTKPKNDADLFLGDYFHKELDLDIEKISSTMEEAKSIINKVNFDDFPDMNININFQELDNAINKMNNSIGEINNSVDEMNNSIGEINNSIDKMDNTINKMITEIDRINNSINTIVSGIDIMINATDGINSSVQHITNSMNSMTNSTYQLNQTILESLDTCDKLKNDCIDELKALKVAIDKPETTNIGININSILSKLESSGNYISTTKETCNNVFVDYIKRSFEKLIGGDYNSENPTTLSVCGEFILGFFDVDLPLDIRDINYDITHWKWDFQSGCKLTLDSLGLLPVIGIIKYGDNYGLLLKSGDKTIIEGVAKPIREQMLESSSAKLWGTLEDGTNQGVKHFADYWEKYPERIPSIAERLGVDASKFENTVDGFNNFTEQVLKVKNNGILREVNGKQIYYLEGATKPKKGVVVIFKDGKIQSMMPSDINSFNKLQ